MALSVNEQLRYPLARGEYIFMADDISVLIVDDDDDILIATRLLLKRHFARVITADHPSQIPGLMEKYQVDVILLDMNFGPGESSGDQGMCWLKQIRAANRDVVTILITAHGNIALAVEAMKHGASDFVIKPWRNEALIANIHAAIQLQQKRRESDRSSGRSTIDAVEDQQPDLLGSSQPTIEIKKLIDKVAPTQANVLILGENGTGKELVARRLHRQSTRAGKVFMAVDMGALTASLFESELFGHQKGAFTGADRQRIGRLQAADGGTLFLDEIGNLSLDLQAKLLTALEQRVVTPLGGNQSVAVDVRVIAATNVAKHRLADERHFRQDLLYRLNTVEISLPPLRERPGDIQAIAEYFATWFAQKYAKPEKVLSGAALEAMRRYQWPGNVRALRHALERAVIFSEGECLEPEDLQLPRPAEVGFAGETHNPPAEEELNLEQLEQKTIEKALRQHNYNVSRAAKALGLTRGALYRRMEKYAL